MRENVDLSHYSANANATQFEHCVKHCFESRVNKTWQNYTVKFRHGKIGKKAGTLIALCPINRHTTGSRDQRLQSLAQSRQCQRAGTGTHPKRMRPVTKPRCHRDMEPRGIGKCTIPPHSVTANRCCLDAVLLGCC